MGEFSTKKGVQERDIVCMYVNMNMRCVCVFRIGIISPHTCHTPAAT